MVARAPAKAETETPPAEPAADDKPVTRGELHAAIAAAIAGKPAEPEAAPAPSTAPESRPRGPREEEDRMEALVSAKVAELVGKESAAGKEPPAAEGGSHEPEQPPVNKSSWKNKIEKAMGWTE